MAEDTQAAIPDPSMEEILASIRKIISDESPPAETPEAATTGAPQEDILELTQMVEADGSVTDVSAPQKVEAPTPAAATPVPPPPPSPPPAAAPVAEKAETLVSEPVASNAASKLSSLANTVEIERLSSAPVTATMIGNSHRTLEDMVIELMRPLLKEWLDQNLTGVVERLVQKEIERISRRS